MPVIAVLDECLTILAKISNHADQGLEYPARQRESLTAIKQCCDEIDVTIKGIAWSIPYDDGDVPAGYVLN